MTSAHPETILVVLSVIGAVCVALIESRSLRPSTHLLERCDRLSDKLAGLNERMTRLEVEYSVYPSVDYLNAFESDTKARLNDLERKTGEKEKPNGRD